MRIHRSAEWQSYLAMFGGLSTLLITSVVGLNYVVDPYLIHQWETPQVLRLRPTREKLSAWGKTYALAKYKPEIVYIGNSRTELGLPTRLPVFEGRSVFNSALSGASLGDAIEMVHHAATVSRLDTIVWGIDPPSFSMELGNTDFDRALVADGPFYLLRRGMLNLQRALTVDMTKDSIRLLRGTFGLTCHSSLAFNGQRDDSCISDRINGWGGTRAAILPRTREYIRGGGPTPEASRALEQTVERVCANGTRLRLYINPTHAMMADALYWAGKWPAMEAWQISLARMAQQRRALGCDIKVYDFSGFNSVTTEVIPQVSQRREMVNYWETSHYRVNVGRMILGRLFDPAGGPAPADFGEELTPLAMPCHLAALRAARTRYHAEHAQESALARAVAAEPKRQP